MAILLFSSRDKRLVTALAIMFCPHSVLTKIVPAIIMNSSINKTHLIIFLKVFRSRALCCKNNQSFPLRQIKYQRSETGDLNGERLLLNVSRYWEFFVSIITLLLFKYFPIVMPAARLAIMGPLSALFILVRL